MPEGVLDNVAAAAGKAEVLAGKVKNKAIALLDDIISFVNKSYAELKKFFDDLFRKIKDWLLKKKDAVKQEVSKILEKFNTKFVYNVLEEGVFRSKLARALAASYDNVSPLIKKLEERIAKYEFEHAAILKDGKVELINGSKPSEVSFNLRQSLKMRNAIVTHNHPSGGSLSAADIRMFLRQGIQELRVKCPDGSVFSLKDKGLKLTKKEIERIINKTSSYIESEYKLGRKISDKDIKQKTTG